MKFTDNMNVPLITPDSTRCYEGVYEFLFIFADFLHNESFW